jgi:hypothetical protein
VISYGTSKTGGQLLKQQWQLEGIEQSKHSWFPTEVCSTFF